MFKINLVLFKSIFSTILFLLFAFHHAHCFAHKPMIVLTQNIVVDKPITYENVTIDLNQYNMTMTNKAALTIRNSVVKGAISKNNPFLFNLTHGTLHLENNKVMVTTKNVAPLPSQYQQLIVIKVSSGTTHLINNDFNIDRPYIVTWLLGNSEINTKYEINNNVLHKFHGGVILEDAHGANINNNYFDRVSMANIFIIGGSDNLISKNTILFSGNNNVGDAIDIFGSTHVDIINNYIAQGSCYGIYILNSNHVRLAQNKIVGGITYGIYLSSGVNIANEMPTIAKAHFLKITPNHNITITGNYLSQNRFGLGTSLTGEVVDNLIVNNNIFIQRFKNNKDRKFWTNNQILLHESKNVIWTNNWYKEAYAQEDFSNDMAMKLVSYPFDGVNL